MALSRILFVSSVNNTPWGGAEQLWSQAALDLVTEGFAVSASVSAWMLLLAQRGFVSTERVFQQEMLYLTERGVEVWFRPNPNAVHFG